MLPQIDVVLPMGSVKWAPYIAIACRFVRMQDYPQDRIGITVSYLYCEKEDLAPLVEVCRDFDVTLVTGAADREDGFRTPLCCVFKRAACLRHRLIGGFFGGLRSIAFRLGCLSLSLPSSDRFRSFFFRCN